MGDGIGGTGAKVRCLRAPAGAGKTTYIAGRVSEMACGGADTGRVLVVANTGAAACSLKERLTGLGVPAEKACVTTPLTALAQVLDGDTATGHGTCLRTRLLVRAEFNVLLEDVKAAGVPTAALRGLLPALSQGLARNLPPEQWGFDDEQRRAYRELRAHLDRLGACLREEMPARVLDRQAAGTAAPFAHVYVDDAQNLSPAALRALARLARGEAVFLGDPSQELPGFDVGFTPGAFAAFAEETGTGLIDLSQQAEPPARRVTNIRWRDADEEFRGVGRIVAGLLHDDPDLLPRDVYVAAPNQTWARAVAGELTRRHIGVQALVWGDVVAGDPRSRARLGTLEAYAALALAATPDSAASWRLWLALGQRDFACGAWAGLVGWADVRGMDVARAVRELPQNGEAFLGADLVRSRAQEANSLLDEMGGLDGFALRGFLCARYPDPRLAAAFEFLEGNEGPAELFAALQGLSFSPSFADRPSQVCVGPYRAALGLSPRHVLMPGLVDAVVPGPPSPHTGDDARDRALNLLERETLALGAMARESFTVSSFQHVDVARASQLGLPAEHARRYRRHDVVPLRRSPLLDSLGDSLPGPVSGEQVFSAERAYAPALRPRAETLRELAGDAIAVHQQRCLRVRNRHAACHACADACTSKCISFKDGTLHVDARACVGCGTCCTACPTCALEALNPNDATLLARARNALRATGDTVVFAPERLVAQGDSRRTLDASKVVAVTNLGRVEESLIAGLVADGARHIVLVQPPAADACEEKGAAMARDVCASANAVLAAWGSDARARIAREFPACVLRTDGTEADAFTTNAGAPGERPSYDDAGKHRPAFTDTAGAMKVMRDGTLPHFVPERRERLFDALLELGEPLDAHVTSRLWGHVRVDPALCTGCRMCAVFCPTGALVKFTDEDGATGIGHAPADCVQCRCCQDVCRSRAITVEGTVPARAVLAGETERFEMPPEELFRSNSHSIHTAVKKCLGIDRLFER